MKGLSWSRAPVASPALASPPVGRGAGSPSWLVMAVLVLSLMPWSSAGAAVVRLDANRHVELPPGARVENIHLAPAGVAGHFVVQWISGMPQLTTAAALQDWLSSRLPEDLVLRSRGGGLWVAASGRQPWMAVLGLSPVGEGWWWSRWYPEGGGELPSSRDQRPAGTQVLGDWVSSVAGRRARHRVWAHPRWPVTQLRTEASQLWRAEGWLPLERAEGAAAPLAWRLGRQERQAVFQSHGEGSAVLVIDEEVGDAAMAP